MAKGDKDKAGSEKASSQDKAAESAAGWDAIPEALRDAGRRASEMAQNPYARSLLAAGLVAAATALASNKNVREATRRNLRTATEAVEVGADNAGKIGLAIVNAATEAVQHLLSLGGVAAAAAANAATAPEAGTPAAKPTAAPRARAAAKPKAPPKPAAAKPAAAKAAPAAARAPARKAPAKAVAAPTAKAAPKAAAKPAASPASSKRAEKDA